MQTWNSMLSGLCEQVFAEPSAWTKLQNNANSPKLSSGAEAFSRSRHPHLAEPVRHYNTIVEHVLQASDTRMPWERK